MKMETVYKFRGKCYPISVWINPNKGEKENFFGYFVKRGKINTEIIGWAKIGDKFYYLEGIWRQNEKKMAFFLGNEYVMKPEWERMPEMHVFTDLNGEGKQMQYRTEEKDFNFVGVSKIEISDTLEEERAEIIKCYNNIKYLSFDCKKMFKINENLKLCRKSL